MYNYNHIPEDSCNRGLYFVEPPCCLWFIHPTMWSLSHSHPTMHAVLGSQNSFHESSLTPSLRKDLIPGIVNNINNCLTSSMIALILLQLFVTLMCNSNN